MLISFLLKWRKAGYPSRITDPAPLAHVGGPSKIDSIQNVILLRSDLHDAWDSYRFGVNPDVRFYALFVVLKKMKQTLIHRLDRLDTW